MSDSISFGIICNYYDFIKLKAEWDFLWLHSKSSFFSSFSWYEALIRAKSLAKEHVDINIVLCRGTNGQLRCIAPLKIEENKVMFLSNHEADYQDFIYSSPNDCEIMLRYVLDYYKNKVILLDSVPEYSCIISNARKISGVNIIDGDSCPILDLNFYDNDRRIESKNFKRKIESLKKLGNVSFFQLYNSQDILNNLARFKMFYRDRWGNDPESSFFFEPFDDFFLAEIVRAFSSTNTVLMSTLILNEQTIAYYFGFLNNKSYLFYRSGFDKRYERQSPGMLLLKLLIDDLVKKRYMEFDFLRGEYPYKSMYSNGLRKNYCIGVNDYGHQSRDK